MIFSRIHKFIPTLIQNIRANNMHHSHSAVLFNKKEAYLGFNHKRTCIRRKTNPSTHAEIDVFKHLNKKLKLQKSLKKFSILVIRVNNSGNICYSKPCANCIRELQQYQIKNIYYSDHNGNIKREKTKNIQNLHVSSVYTKCFSLS